MFTFTTAVFENVAMHRKDGRTMLAKIGVVLLLYHMPLPRFSLFNLTAQCRPPSCSHSNQQNMSLTRLSVCLRNSRSTVMLTSVWCISRRPGYVPPALRNLLTHIFGTSYCRTQSHAKRLVFPVPALLMMS